MIDLTRYKRVLTFFAHPDDETLAAGGTIARMIELGVDVMVAIPATGVHSRRPNISQNLRDAQLHELRSNCRTALEVLGVSANRVILGEFADNEMDRHTLLELVHWLEALVREFEPDLVLTHHRYCTNIDHQYCHEAAIVATRPGETRRTEVWSGEVPSSTGYLRPAAWEPNLAVRIDEQHLRLKIMAMQTYVGEARPYPHPRSPETLRALAMVRGSEAGHALAEAFVVNRIYG